MTAFEQLRDATTSRVHQSLQPLQTTLAEERRARFDMLRPTESAYVAPLTLIAESDGSSNSLATGGERTPRARQLGDFASLTNEQLVNGLGSPDSNARELAHARLQARGLTAIHALRDATFSDDLEVSRRAGALIRHIERPLPLGGFDAMDRIPLVIRDRIQGLFSQVTEERPLNRTEIDELTRPEMRSKTATMALFQLACMTSRDGDNALDSALGRQLTQLLRQVGPESAQALFATMDNFEVNPRLRGFAREQVDRITRNLNETSPVNWLRDIQGRVRRIGNPNRIQESFQADYGPGGALTFARAGEISVQVLPEQPGTARLDLLRIDGTVRGSNTHHGVQRFSIVDENGTPRINLMDQTDDLTVGPPMYPP